MLFVAIVPATAFGTPTAQQSGNFNVSVAGTAVGSIPHQIDLKVTQLPGGQLSQVAGFIVSPEEVVQVKQGENLIVSTSPDLRTHKVTVRNIQGISIALIPLPGNAWSLQGLLPGVYTLNVNVAMSSSGIFGIYETILVILEPNQQPLPPTPIINQITIRPPPPLILIAVATLLIMSDPVSTQTSGNFSTFTNNGLGFTMLYPYEWEVEHYSSEGVDKVFLAPNNDYGVVVYTTPYASNVDALEKLANRVNANNPDSLYHAMDLRIAQVNTSDSLGGYPAVRIVSSYPVGQTQMGLVYEATAAHGTLYEIKLNAEASQMALLSPVYEQMVNSFQIMK